MSEQLDAFSDLVPQGGVSSDRVWTEGVEIACSNGRKMASVRPQIGRLLKAFEADKIMSALEQSKGKRDPLNYARRILNGQVDDGLEGFLNEL